MTPVYRLDAVLLDAFGTLFAPVSAGSPDEHLWRLLASDGVNISLERAGRAIVAEVQLYRAKFPHLRSETELQQLELEASDLVLQELGLTGFSRDRMRQHLIDLFTLTAYADAQPTLELLQQRGLELGVVSNYNALLESHLTNLGLAEWFGVFVNSAEYGSAKPDPGMFHEATRILGIAPERVLYVGDDLVNDYHGAKDADLHAVWLNRDYAPVEDGVRAISSLADLPVLLDQEFS
jgi:putative hydrolase of the HAD superfamily